MMYQQRNTAVDLKSRGGASTAVHDGFATVRRPHHYVGHKRRRAAASVGLHLEPVSEHVVGEQQQKQQPSSLYAGHRPKSSYDTAAALPPLPSDVPWWEIATRRRPRSCADFTSASDNVEKVQPPSLRLSDPCSSLWTGFPHFVRVPPVFIRLYLAFDYGHYFIPLASGGSVDL